MSVFYCDMCFNFPAVARARNVFLCSYCLDTYSKQFQPKYRCSQCEEPKYLNHRCSDKALTIDEVLGKLKWM